LLNSSKFVAFASHLNAGDRPRVDFEQIGEYPFPLAPLPEQKRIVEEIEIQFTRLDAAVTALKHVQSNLKRYRTAVLKAACEGRLVPIEAALGRHSYEPASDFLERLRAERTILGKVRPELTAPHAHAATKLPKLPNGWLWTTLSEILISIEAGKSFKCEERPPNDKETGVVKVSAVTWGEFDEKESKTCIEPTRINEKYIIQPGDFLFSRANTIQLVGACVIVKHITSRLMLSDKILRFKFASLPNEWVLYVLRSQFGRSEIERLSTGNQESMRNIGQERIRSIRIPLPPAAELHRLVVELERRLSIITESESQIESNLRRAWRLRKSILEDAFEGKIVPQGPTDEPASELLKRVRFAQVDRISHINNSEMERGRFAMSQQEMKRQTIVEILRKAKTGMPPEELFSACRYEPESVDDFFIELKAQIENGTVVEKRHGDKITLRVK
jgi:type I restriction enzyme S subunit